MELELTKTKAETMNIPGTPREIRYDLLRIVAACMVVMLHVSASKWYTTPYNTIEWATMNLYDSFMRSAVPLFFMLSGAFILRKEMTMRKLYGKKILTLLGVYIVWSVLYAIDTVGLTGFGQVGLIGFLKTVSYSKYHLWFLPALMGAYVLQPILYAVVNFKKGKYVPYLVLCFLCFGVLKPTIVTFLGVHEIVYVVMGKISVELVSYTGYMILGYYLANVKKVKLKAKTALLLFVIVSLIATVIGQLDAIRKGDVSGILYGDFLLPVFLEAIFIFIFFQNVTIKKAISPKVRMLIQKVAPLTMSIYLFHPFVQEHLDLIFGFHSLAFNPVLSIPIVTLTIVLICIFVGFIMIKIPVVKRFWKV